MTTLFSTSFKAFLSTPSGWRATHGILLFEQTAGSDFYPRPPGGGRLRPQLLALFLNLFLSTPSGWRATGPTSNIITYDGISIHALRVEGDLSLFPTLHGLAAISIHALRVEGDTGLSKALAGINKISIHALRVEGDSAACLIASSTWYFYPRPPGGGRRGKAGTRPLSLAISIHALRVEGDKQTIFNAWAKRYFYPRPPGGGRLSRHDPRGSAQGISIHALRVEGDGGRTYKV